MTAGLVPVLPEVGPVGIATWIVWMSGNNFNALKSSTRLFLAQARSLVFRGNRVECPCCGKTFSGFLYSPHMAARCPFCMSVERYRLLCMFLEAEMGFGKSPIRFLDIAPLWCFQYFCRRHPNVEYVSVDISSPLAQYHMDIQELGFPDVTFDAVLCYHVLEHVPDDRKALSELFRILKPGGWALIQVPLEAEKTAQRYEILPEEQDRILKWTDHLRVYGEDFFDLLKAIDFEVRTSDFVLRFSDEEIRRFGLDRKERLTICTKPSS